jgi:hypothetical protein
MWNDPGDKVTARPVEHRCCFGLCRAFFEVGVKIGDSAQDRVPADPSWQYATPCYGCHGRLGAGAQGSYCRESHREARDGRVDAIASASQAAHSRCAACPASRAQRKASRTRHSLPRVAGQSPLAVQRKPPCSWSIGQLAVCARVTHRRRRCAKAALFAPAALCPACFVP